MKIILFILAALLNFGCTSDSGSTAQAGLQRTQPSSTGEFLVAGQPASGIQYVTTSGITGATDQNGQYSYKEGDRIRFSVAGQIPFGEVLATPMTTTFSLNQQGQSTDPFTQAAVAIQERIISQFAILALLDADSDPSNGISLSSGLVSSVLSVLSGQFDFLAVGAALFDNFNLLIQRIGSSGLLGQAGIFATEQELFNFVQSTAPIRFQGVWAAQSAAQPLNYFISGDGQIFEVNLTESSNQVTAEVLPDSVGNLNLESGAFSILGRSPRSGTLLNNGLSLGDPALALRKLVVPGKRLALVI